MGNCLVYQRTLDCRPVGVQPCLACSHASCCELLFAYAGTVMKSVVDLVVLTVILKALLDTALASAHYWECIWRNDCMKSRNDFGEIHNIAESIRRADIDGDFKQCACVCMIFP